MYSNDERYKFGQRVKFLWEHAGIDLMTFAKSINLPKEAIEYIFSGEYRVDVNELIAIAKTLNVSADCLLGLDERNVINLCPQS